MNSVTLIGRLTRDPDIRYTSNNMAVASFSIAIDRPVKQGEEKKADFPRIKVFGRVAESCEKYIYKGSKVGIEGRIQTGSYQNRDGQTVYTTDVIANRVEFLDARSDSFPDNNDATQAGRESHVQESRHDDPRQERMEEVPNFRAINEDVPF